MIAASFAIAPTPQPVAPAPAMPSAGVPPFPDFVAALAPPAMAGQGTAPPLVAPPVETGRSLETPHAPAGGAEDKPVELSAEAPAAIESPIAVDSMVDAMIAALPQPVANAAAPQGTMTTASAEPQNRPVAQPAAPDHLAIRSIPVALPKSLPGKSAATAKPDDLLDPVPASTEQPAFSTRHEATTSIAPAPPATPPLPSPAARAEVPMPLAPRDLMLDSDGEWLASIARDIARAADSSAPLSFRLRPDALGELRVDLARRDDATSVRLTVESEAARAALADGQARLVAEARSHGIRINETLVQLSDNGTAQNGDRRHSDHPRPPVAANGPQRTDRSEAANHGSAETTDRYA